MGKTRKENVLEAQSRDEIGRTVSTHCFGSVLMTLRLFTSQLETHKHKEALALIETLLVELKRIDDKMILTEVHLLESRVHRGIGNFAKAKVPPGV
jgi:hypothetical protein